MSKIVTIRGKNDLDSHIRKGMCPTRADGTKTPFSQPTCHIMDVSAQLLMKGATSCDKLRVGACNRWSGDPRMGILHASVWTAVHGNSLKRSIIISEGKESKCDSVSKGDRKRNRPNRILYGDVVYGLPARTRPRGESPLEWEAIKGDSPVTVPGVSWVIPE